MFWYPTVLTLNCVPLDSFEEPGAKGSSAQAPNAEPFCVPQPVPAIPVLWYAPVLPIVPPPLLIMVAVPEPILGVGLVSAPVKGSKFHDAIWDEAEREQKKIVIPAMIFKKEKYFFIFITFTVKINIQISLIISVGKMPF